MVQGDAATQIKSMDTDRIDRFVLLCNIVKSFVTVTILSGTSELVFQNIRHVANYLQ